MQQDSHRIGSLSLHEAQIDTTFSPNFSKSSSTMNVCLVE